MKLFRDLSTLFSANLIGQLIAFATIPLLTRIYSPDDFGVFQLVSAIALVLSPFVIWSYDQAITYSTSEHSRLILLRSGVATTIISSLILVMILYSVIKDLESYSILSTSHWILLYLLCLTSGLFVITQSFLIGSRKYSNFSKNALLMSSLSNSAKILLGAVSPTAFSLIFSVVIGNVIACIQGKLRKQIIEMTFRRNVSTFIKYKKFTVQTTLSQAILIALNWSLFIAAPIFASNENLGLLALAIALTRTTTYPFLSSVVNYAISNARILTTTPLEFIVKISRVSVAGSATITLGIVASAILGEQIISLIFGHSWASAALFSTYLLIPIAFNFLLQPITTAIAFHYSIQANLLKIDVLFCPIMIGSFLMANQYTSDLQTLTLINSLILSSNQIVKFLAVLKRIRLLKKEQLN